jgi:periplasmic divalent cation tolerance protein
MDQIRVVMITVPTEDAETMAQEIVKRRLAACVNVVPEVKSFFWWDDDVQIEEESLLIVKTTTTRFDELLAHVRETHSYELPEVIALPLSDAFGDYVDWVKKETGADQ